MKIFLHSSLLKSNFGDELLTIILAKKIVERFPDAKVFIRARLDVYERICIHAPVTNLGTLVGLRSMDFVVFGGGGYFGSPSETLSIWDLGFIRRMLPLLFFLKAFKIKTLVICVGAGPLPNWFCRSIVKGLVQKAEPLIVRDRESRLFMQSLGYDPKMLPDLVSIPGLLDRPNMKEKSVILIHNLTDFRVLEQLIRLYGGSKTFYILQDSEKPLPPEALSWPTLEKRVRLQTVSHTDAYATVDLIAASEVVYTKKLHVGITASTLGSIVLCAPHHLKTQRYYRQHGLDEFCFKDESLIVEKLGEFNAPQQLRAWADEIYSNKTKFDMALGQLEKEIDEGLTRRSHSKN